MGWWFQTFTTGKWLEITISIRLKMVVIGVPGIYRGMLWLSIVFLDFFFMVMHGQCLGAGGKKQNIFPKWWFNGESSLVERIAHVKNHEYIDAKTLGGCGEKNKHIPQEDPRSKVQSGRKILARSAASPHGDRARWAISFTVFTRPVERSRAP